MPVTLQLFRYATTSFVFFDFFASFLTLVVFIDPASCELFANKKRAPTDFIRRNPLPSDSKNFNLSAGLLACSHPEPPSHPGDSGQWLERDSVRFKAQTLSR